MARAQVTHSEDAVQITFDGDKRRPEPATAVIKFPGGHVEVSRCTDGSYWAHVSVVDNANVVGSRIDYAHGTSRDVRSLPDGDLAIKVALRVSNAAPHFNPDAA